MLQSLLRRQKSARSPKTSQPKGRTRPTLTALEDRVTPYVLSGYQWASPDITASFMPDGTVMSGDFTSSLFAEMDAVAPTETWQREFARALQTWAQYAPLNFSIVPDDGSPQATYGPLQGDPRFGDIRLGARPAPTNVLGTASYPTNGSTASGDIRLNTNVTYRIGSGTDIFSVLLHESGHSLGVRHSDVAGSVMYYSYAGAYPGLSADDIAGIQAIYGVRQHDTYDAAASNDSRRSATALSSGDVSVRADLTSLSDLDYYQVVASGSSLTVSVDARNLSLLAPRVQVFDANGNLLGSADADYGRVATLNLGGLTAGQTYYLVADGATADVFGAGAYALDVKFGAASPAEPPAAPTGLSAVAVTSGQIDLSWQDNADDETGYQVEWSTDGVTFTPAGTAGANATTYTATGLTADTTYHFRVRAINTGGSSPWSNTAQATTPGGSVDLPPAAPTGLSVVAVSTGRIDLAWQDNAGDETGYRVEVSTDGTNFAPAGTVPADATSFAATGLADGTTYSFRVRAYNAAGDSDWSNTAQADTPPAEPPSTPTLTPDRFESNDTPTTAQDLGRLNSTSQPGLTVHSAADVDWLAFTVSSSGTFTVSIVFTNAAGNLDLYVFDAQERMMAGGVTAADNEVVTMTLSGGQSYYLKVVSGDGGVNTYDLVIGKAGGKGRGGKGNNLLDGLTLGGYGSPMSSGATAQSPVSGDGAGQSQDGASPTVEFMPLTDGTDRQAGLPDGSGGTVDGSAAGWSQALRLLAELDLPIRSGPVFPV